MKTPLNKRPLRGQQQILIVGREFKKRWPTCLELKRLLCRNLTVFMSINLWFVHNVMNYSLHPISRPNNNSNNEFLAESLHHQPEKSRGCFLNCHGTIFAYYLNHYWTAWKQICTKNFDDRFTRNSISFMTAHQFILLKLCLKN